MTTQDLELAILEIINRIYCKYYCGKIKVKELFKVCPKQPCEEPVKTITGYQLILGLNNTERPLIISYEGDVEKFLIHIAKELKVRRLSDTEFYTGYQVINERCDDK